MEFQTRSKKYIILGLIIVALVFYTSSIFIPFPEALVLSYEESEYMSNITKLNSKLVSPDIPESYLNVTCEEKRKYYHVKPKNYLGKKPNSKLCYVCNEKYDICFIKYSTRRGLELGPPSLRGDYSKEDKLQVLSFGISEALNCNYRGKFRCSEGITASIEESNTEKEIPHFYFPEEINITEKIEWAANQAGKDGCEFKEKTGQFSARPGEEKVRYFKCQELEGIVFRKNRKLKNTMIIFQKGAVNV